MPHRILLLCGLASSIFYVATDVIGALSYAGYDYTSQAISEMSAIGAPTAALLSPLYIIYAALFTAFGIGFMASADTPRLQGSAGSIIVVGLLGMLVWPFFPMNERGANGSFTDTVHLVLGASDVLLLVLAIALASSSFGKRFRLYSWASILIMLTAGGLTSLYVPRVGAGEATPWMGILERLSLAAYLLWIGVLSLKLTCYGRAGPKTAGMGA